MAGSVKVRSGGPGQPDWGKWQFIVTVISRIFITPLLEHFWSGGNSDGRLL